MSSRSKRVFFGEYVFLVNENVYEPAEDSFQARLFWIWVQAVGCSAF
jgi:hypothetical protein